MTQRLPITDPNGIAYPPSVQHFVATFLRDADPGVVPHLIHALEATRAVEREHHDSPELDQQQHDRLVNIYAAGMGSGGATALMQLEVQPERAQQMGLMIAGRMLEDPATRLMLEDMTTRMWTGAYDEPIQWQSFTAYPSPRNHRDD